MRPVRDRGTAGHRFVTSSVVVVGYQLGKSRILPWRGVGLVCGSCPSLVALISLLAVTYCCLGWKYILLFCSLILTGVLVRAPGFLKGRLEAE